MSLDIVVSVPGLGWIEGPVWNVAPIKKVKKDVYLVLFTIQHHTSAAYIATHLDALLICCLDYFLPGGNYIRFPAQINVFRDHLASSLLCAGNTLRGDFRRCQPTARTPAPSQGKVHF